jgi:hypothetical protein
LFKSLVMELAFEGKEIVLVFHSVLRFMHLVLFLVWGFNLLCSCGWGFEPFLCGFQQFSSKRGTLETSLHMPGQCSCGADYGFPPLSEGARVPPL